MVRSEEVTERKHFKNLASLSGISDPLNGNGFWKSIPLNPLYSPTIAEKR